MKIHRKDIISLTHDGMSGLYELVYNKRQMSGWQLIGNGTNEIHETISHERYEKIMHELSDYQERVRELEVNLWKVKKQIDEQSHIDIGESC